MSMMKRFTETRKAAKVEKINEVKGFDYLMHLGEVETSGNNLVSWGTVADHERANQALVNHFTSRR